MALDFGMPKREFYVFALIAICFIGFESMMIIPAFTTDGQGEVEFSFFYDRLLAYNVDYEFYAPLESAKKGWYFYNLELGSLYEGRNISLGITVEDGILVRSVSYIRSVAYYVEGNVTSNVKKSDQFVGSLVRHGNATVIEFETPSQMTWSNPFVILVAVLCMGFDGNLPASRVFGNITYI